MNLKFKNMKRNLLGIGLAVFSVFVASCSESVVEGRLTEIGLEKTEIKTSSESCSFSVKTTKETNWSITRLVVCVEGKETFIENTFYIKDINGDKVNTYHETMSGDWYEASKSAPDELTVELSANDTDKERKLTVTIAGGGTIVEHLTVIQEKSFK